MSKLTLDEAIKHCEEVAELNEIDAITYKHCKEIKTNLYEKLTAEKVENDCRKCAASHRQLAEWLTELRDRQWVSCKDRMPEDNTLVLFVYVSENGVKSVHYGYHQTLKGLGSSWAKPSGGWHYYDDDITHWQPLPEPPKEDGKDD